MRTRNLVGLLAILVILEGSVGAWQNQPVVQERSPAPNKQSTYGSGPGQIIPPQPYGRPDGLLPGQQSQTAPGALQTGDPDMPSYPYPKYHNPYYDGTEPGSVISEMFQWLREIQSGVMERVSNIIDSRFFPAKPATDGGGSR
jgi:hypothetical protein